MASEVMFTAGKGELAAGLAWAVKGLPTRPAVPVLAGVHLQATLGTVTVSGFDYDMTARARVPADVTAAGTVLARGKELATAVKGLPGGKAAQVTAMSDGDTLTLECDGVSASVELLPAGDYPQLPAMPAEVASVDGSVLAGAVGRVGVCASTDDTLPAITAVLLDFGDAGITFAATDRYRLGVETAAATVTEAGRKAAIPAKILAVFAKLAAKGERVSVHLAPVPAGHKPGFGGDDAMAGLSDGVRDLIIRTRDAGTFPSYAKLLPKTAAVTATADAGALAEAVKRAGAAAGKGEAVTLEFRSGRVTVTARRDGRRASSAAVPCRLDMGDVAQSGPGYRVIGHTVAYNPLYLAGVLAGLKGTVRLSWSKARGAMLVTPDGAPRDGFRGLVMPIRIWQAAIKSKPKPEPAATPEPAEPVAHVRPATPQTTPEPASGQPAIIPGLKDRHGRDVTLKPGKAGPWPGATFSLTASVAGGTRHVIATWHPSGHTAAFDGKRAAVKFVKAHEAAWAEIQAEARQAG
jgi:DNA polymerase-3 subunit beta